MFFTCPVGLGRYLISIRVPLYLYWASQLSSCIIEVLDLGMQVLGLGGKIYWVVFIFIAYLIFSVPIITMLCGRGNRSC